MKKKPYRLHIRPGHMLVVPALVERQGVAEAGILQVLNHPGLDSVSKDSTKLNKPGYQSSPRLCPWRALESASLASTLGDSTAGRSGRLRECSQTRKWRPGERHVLPKGELVSQAELGVILRFPNSLRSVIVFYFSHNTKIDCDIGTDSRSGIC